jgi:hypothetical protein
MKSEALQSCYSFWHKRQVAGNDAFLFKHVQASDLRIPSKKRKYTHDHQDKGSGRHMTRHQSTADHQEEGSGQRLATPEVPTSASPEPGPLYAVILCVFCMYLSIIRNTHHKSPTVSRSPSPHLDDVTGVSGKAKAQPIEMYGSHLKFLTIIDQLFPAHPGLNMMPHHSVIS